MRQVCQSIWAGDARITSAPIVLTWLIGNLIYRLISAAMLRVVDSFTIANSVLTWLGSNTTIISIWGPSMIAKLNDYLVSFAGCATCLSFDRIQIAKYRSVWLNFDFPACFSDWFAANWRFSIDLGTTGRFACHQCANNYKHKHHLVRHLRKGCAKDIKCPRCSFSSRIARVLQAHVRCHDNNRPARVLYKCELCSYMTRKKTHYRQHLMAKQCGRK